MKGVNMIMESRKTHKNTVCNLVFSNDLDTIMCKMLKIKIEKIKTGCHNYLV